MTYIINKTDGNLVAQIPDGTLDTSSTSLSLIGKNTTNFGQSINENFVKLLENFASSTAPEQALKGQLWYDTSTGRLNIYDGSSFRASGAPLISSIQPTDMVPGDLWINNETNQLHFYDGTDLILAGPIYTDQQGETGFKVESVLDTLNRSRVIAKLFVNNSLIGIFSRVAFTPLFPISEFSGPIGVGFTASTLTNLKFDVTVTRAEKIITSLGEEKLADDIVFNNENGIINGSLTVQSTDGLRLLGGDPGASLDALGDVFLRLESGNFIIENAESRRSIEIRTKKPIEGTKTAMFVDAVNQRIGFFNNAPQAAVDITGDLKISGNLLVSGETLSISVTNVALQDKNIELNKPEVGSPTDSQADGGGITLKGDTDKTISWIKQTPINSSSWTSSENFDLAETKEYRIGNDSVLSSTTLGPGVLNSSLKTLGNLTTLNMVKGVGTGINITGDTITGNSDLILTSATGNVSVNNKRIINLPNLDFVTSPGSDAANKKYVDDQVYNRPIPLTVDVSNFDLSTEQGEEDANLYIIDVLNNVAPIYDPITYTDGTAIEGTLAKVHTTCLKVQSTNIVYKPVETGFKTDPAETEAYTRVAVNLGAGTENQPVVRDLAVNQVIPAPINSVIVTTVNKRFKVKRQIDGSLAWKFVTNFVFKGVWNTNLSYAVGDVVMFNNVEYICTVPTTSIDESPAETPIKWNLLSSM